MHSTRRILGLLVIAAGILTAGVPATAWAGPAVEPRLQTNLLKNPGFEDGFTSGVANNWSRWTISDANATPENNCGRREPTFQQMTSAQDPRRVKDGSSAQQILTPVQDPGFGFYGGLQQTVTGLTPGKTYRFTVWAHAWSSTKDNPALSEGTGPAYFEVGIGQGSTFAADPGIKRSGIKDIKDTYQQLTVDAVANGSSITVFTYANPSACSKHNEAFFDAASLTEVGAAATSTAGAVQPTATLPLRPTNFPTPTPNAEGRIVYTVQPGDSIIHICEVIGRGTDITCIDDIMKMNGLSSKILTIGQQLVIGTTGAPIQPTATAAPTEALPPTAEGTAPTAEAQGTPAEATQAPQATQAGTGGAGAICVTLYNDANGSGGLDPGEGLVAGGTFGLLDLNASTTVATYTTDGASEPHCFENLKSGNYRVTSTVPDTFKATTRTDWDLTLAAGSTANLEFGAQSTGGTGTGGTGGTGGGSNASALTRALLAAAGVVFLLVAAGVAGFLLLTRRR